MTTEKPELPTLTPISSFDVVRLQAKTTRRYDIKLPKSEVRTGRDSLQKIRTLKSIERDIERPEEPALVSLDIFSKLWGLFQTAIGNR